jgi:hypothetical protein
MLHTFLTVAGGFLAAATLVAGLIYLFSVRRVNRLYREMQFAEREDVRSKAASYWSVETIRRRTALVGLIAYAVVLVGFAIIGEAKEGWRLYAVLTASAGMAAIAITATINNMKQTEMRIEADVARRYKRLV